MRELRIKKPIEYISARMISFFHYVVFVVEMSACIIMINLRDAYNFVM